MGFLKAVLAISVAVFGFTLGRDMAHKTMTPAAGQ
jgi:hypothetical protein